MVDTSVFAKARGSPTNDYQKIKKYNTDTRLEKWPSGSAVASSPGPRCWWAPPVVGAEGAQAGSGGAGSCPAVGPAHRGSRAKMKNVKKGMSKFAVFA